MIAGQGKKKYLEVDNQRGEGIYDDNSQARWCWYFMYLPWYSFCWERVMMVAIMMMCDVADVGISFCLFNDSYFMFITQIRPYISEIF